jgi:hypothetical protein
MAILFYVARAFTLLVCCVSGSHRAKALARWKKSPPHRVVLEVGGGVVGLLVLVEIIYLIIISSTG